jgi:hypothetical protein
MTLERILLQTIKFDLQIEHPYQYLLKYAKALQGDKQKLQKMVQMAWTFVNDRYVYFNFASKGSGLKNAFYQLVHHTQSSVGA